jgi:hypothetical protein
MTLLEQLKEKGEQNKLQTRLTTRTIELMDGSALDRTELFIQIPFEREFKTLIVDDKSEGLERIINSPFEKYKLLKGHEAIYSQDLGIIECEIQTDDPLRSGGMLLRRLSRIFKLKQVEIEAEKEETDDEVENFIFEFPSPDDFVKIFIRQSSDEFSFLSGYKRDSLMFRRKLRVYPTIRIEGLSFLNHAQAKELLTNIANSVLFQIDLITNIPIHLASDIDLQREIRIRRKVIREEIKFSPPKNQYDSEAISLYWYARTAINMPLLQFLAFYQVLEFYFPLYSSKEAQDRIKNLLKDPTFDRNADKNVAKILEVIKVYSKGKSIGDERSQIKAAIQACVDQNDLLDFFNESEDRSAFFDDQKKSKSLVSQKVSFNRKDHDFRVDVASRIYDLRCRIVHTKDDADIQLLLPFSQDLIHIKYDIELIEFVARKVLIASGKPINLKI